MGTICVLKRPILIAAYYSARNVIAAILKRLTHRTANVQLYTLTLAESLTKNCGIAVHREIASRAFTAGLDRLITDRVRDPYRGFAFSLRVMIDFSRTEHPSQSAKACARAHRRVDGRLRERSHAGHHGGDVREPEEQR